jgi:uncharacterized phage protein (TIGR01671 family)
MYENSDFSDYCKDEWWGYEEQMALEALDLFDNPEHYILMQSTGLKDKKGKLIYEGDYIKNLKTNTIYKVFWEDKATCFMLKSTRFGGVVSTYMMFEEYPNDLEVIGNIYENPELLEVSNDH